VRCGGEAVEMAEARLGWRHALLSGGIALISRGLMARDALLGVAKRMPRAASREEIFLRSGGRRLAAVWVAAGAGAPAVLLCHGIGETVEHWSAVQAYLLEHGVSSLVFNYSGYGRSEGRICTENCEEDLTAAYGEMLRRVSLDTRVFVLGFSLGSGIAANGIAALVPAPAGLFLCEAFTSMREAARAGGAPGWMVREIPDIWDTVRAMETVRVPVCVVHSDGDGLFPVRMARSIAAACGEQGELIVVHGLGHNEPYLKPADAYWGPIVERMLRAR